MNRTTEKLHNIVILPQDHHRVEVVKLCRIALRDVSLSSADARWKPTMSKLEQHLS
jgi:hypothetical protein